MSILDGLSLLYRYAGITVVYVTIVIKDNLFLNKAPVVKCKFIYHITSLDCVIIHAIFENCNIAREYNAKLKLPNCASSCLAKTVFSCLMCWSLD